MTFRIYALIFCLGITQLQAQQNSNLFQTNENESSLWLTFQPDEQKSLIELKEDTIFKRSKDDDFEILTTENDLRGYQHHRFRQTYKGVPIEGATLIMHEKNNLVTHANGKLAYNFSINTNPSITKKEALEIVQNDINANVYAWENPLYEDMLKQVNNDTTATHLPSGELIITKSIAGTSKNGYKLAYKFTIYTIEPLAIKTAYVNAHNGEIIGYVEKMNCCTNHVTAQGATHYSDEVEFTTCFDDNVYSLQSEINGVSLKVFNAANTTGFNAEILVTDQDGFFEADSAAAEVFWSTAEFSEYLNSMFGRNSIDNNNKPLHSWVHFGDQVNKAFWNGTWMVYGDGDGYDFSSLTTPDIVGHEISHGMIDFTANLQYQFESGALNESFADIFAEVFEYYLNQKYAMGSNDWLIGKDCVMAAGKTCLRNMSNPNDHEALSRQPNTYMGNNWFTGSNDNGGVHHNSGIQNYWFYLLATGGSGINDNGIEYELNGIGIDKAAAIAYRNLTVYLTEYAQYADARKGSIQAAKDLFGENSNEVLQTEAAWSAVGVGPQFGLNNCSRQTDSLALLSLFNATTGNGWTTSWNLSNAIDTWYGVHLNLYGCVSCLDLDGLNDCADSYSLSGNNLTGNIPAELGNLSNLTFLDLNSNNLTGTTIPPGLGNLSNLVYLDLDESGLNGNIPGELGDLINLEHLDIDRNNLTGEIPFQLGSLTKLVELDLDRNQLTGSIPSEFGNLNKLTQLDLRSKLDFQDNNNLSGCFHPDLKLLCDQLISTGTYINSGNSFDATWDNFCNTNAGECSCRQIDSLALVSLYNATNGFNWSNNTNWLQQPLHTWHGVTLNAMGCVTKLDLSNNQLNGNLPVKIAEMTSLNELILPYNQITGNIPVEITELNELTILDLGWNQLTGNIPEELSRLTNLQGLFLGWNDLTGNIPVVLNNLTNLLYLWLNENELTGNIPKQLGNLTQLKDLILFNNNLYGCYDNNLANLCGQLNPVFDNNYHLSDGNNFDSAWEDYCMNNAGICTCRQIDSLALVALYNTTNGADWINNSNWLTQGQTIDTWHGISINSSGCVSCIDLDGIVNCSDTYSNTGNNLTGYIPTEIGNLESLTFLDLSFNNIGGNIPDTIGNLSELEYLDLDENNLTGNIPPSLGYLSNLQILDIDHNQLSGFIPSELGNLNNLTEIDFDYNQLIGQIPSSFGNMLNLTQLDLRYNKLSGCYSNNLLNLCTQLNSSATYITNGNNFMNSWTDFCNNLAGNCSEIPVYPGDFNNDGTANVFDLPYWGIAYGNEGLARSGANTSWTPQTCDDWQNEINGINNKHQDADGNGIVDDNDLVVLDDNYNETFVVSNPVEENSNSPFVFRLEYIDSVPGTNLLQFDLLVESIYGSNETINLHGLAVNIDLSEFPISEIDMDEGNFDVDITNSSLQPNDYIFKFENNQLSLGLSRIDKVNQTCDESLSRIRLPVVDIKSGDPLEFRFGNGELMAATGYIIPINSSNQYFSLLPEVGISSDFLASVLVSFNQCGNGGIATVNHGSNNTDNYTYLWDSGETTQHVTNLPVGAQQVVVTNSQGISKTIDFEVQWSFIPVEVTGNNAKICINFSEEPLSELVQVSIDDGQSYQTSITASKCYNATVGTHHVWIKLVSDQCPVDLGLINVSGSVCRTPSNIQANKVELNNTFSRFVANNLEHNYLIAEKTYIRHQKEIHQILNSNDAKYEQVQNDFSKISKLAVGIMLQSFVSEKIIEVNKEHHLTAIHNFLLSLSEASNNKQLKADISQLSQYVHVMGGKEVKDALNAFDKAGTKDAIPEQEIQQALNEAVFEAQLLNNPHKEAMLYYTLPKQGTLMLKVYDAKGEQLMKLKGGSSKGRHLVPINKASLPKGIYFVYLNYVSNSNTTINKILKLPVM